MTVCFSELSRKLDHQPPPADQWVRPAAVMVMISGVQDAELLLIKRPATMTYHAGQIAFPGGSYESLRDASLSDTARRETQEEVGIVVLPSQCLGFLRSVYIPVSGFTILPVVARLPKPEPPVLSSEVVQAEWVPIRTLRHVRRSGSRRIQGVVVHWPEFPLPLGLLWGATARVVDDLLERWP